MTELAAIGHVRSPHRTAADTPIQARLTPDTAGSIEILPEYLPGLEGLDDFDYAWMLTLLHLDPVVDDGTDPLRPVPFLATDPDQHVGVFATRYPARPNPIGLSLIHIIGVDGNTVEFSGVDVVDGTPVLDIKPWVPAFDLPHRSPEPGFEDLRIGWYRDSKLGRR